MPFNYCLLLDRQDGIYLQMNRLSDLSDMLQAVKNVFSRQQSWLVFCAILLSFLAASEMVVLRREANVQGRNLKAKSVVNWHDSRVKLYGLVINLI